MRMDRRTAVAGMSFCAVILCSSACGSGSGGSSGGEHWDPSALFAGSWLCTLVLNEQGGITDLYPSAFKLDVSGTGLSIFGEDSDSQQQSWFCGFNYTIDGLNASLVGMPVCRSNSKVTLQSAAISVGADGMMLTLQESGNEYEYSLGKSYAATISGTCSRN